jgi:hypothetical protein
MADKTPDVQMLLRVLTAHYRSLSSARCDEAILRQYSRLLRVLRGGGLAFQERTLSPKVPKKPRKKPLGISETRLKDASLDEILKLLNNEETPCSDLEQIAIVRFSVPSGSMRSFSNKRMLVDKLRTLVENERAHETIGEVARGNSRTD